MQTVTNNSPSTFNQEFKEELDLIPSVPFNIKVRLTGLMKEVKLKPNNDNLKIDLFHLATSHLYSTMPLPSEKKVVIIGCVLNDGVGDYYHILNAAETLKKKFSDAKITMIANHYTKNLPNMVRRPFDAEIETIFCEKEMFVDSDYSHISPLLKNVDQIIEISQETTGIIDYNTRHDLSKYKLIYEYGFHVYENNEITKSMGLTNSHLGIIIKEKPQTESLCTLENEKLKEILFKTINPSEKDVEAYLSTSEPYIGYLKAGSYYQMAFIYTTVALFKSSEKQVIDLIIPEVKTTDLNKEFLKEQGIGRISSIKIENGKIIKSEFSIADNGKELRLINPFPLEQKDFYKLLMNTNPLVGCTGDHSFSEAISFDRLPFYELRKPKLWFLNSLISLAKKVGTEPYYLKQYLQEIYNILDHDQEKFIDLFKNYDGYDEEEKKSVQWTLREFKGKQFRIAKASLKIAHLLQQPEITAEFQALNELLKSQYSFNPSLINIVERQLILNTYPDLKKLENEVQKEFLNGRVTLIQAIDKINKKIKDLQNPDFLSQEQH